MCSKDTSPPPCSASCCVPAFSCPFPRPVCWLSVLNPVSHSAGKRGRPLRAEGAVTEMCSSLCYIFLPHSLPPFVCFSGPFSSHRLTSECLDCIKRP